MDIERLYRMHKQIESNTTGTPDEFAEKFEIKRRQLYNLLEELRHFGAVITYCRARKTFFYAEPFDFFDEFGYDLLSRQKNRKILTALLKEHFEKNQKR